MSSDALLSAPRHHRRLRLRWWQKFLLVIVAAIALCAVAIAIYTAFVFNRYHFPLFGRPAFDTVKAGQLTPDQRAAYEEELFSELYLWNQDDFRYPEGSAFVLREQHWQELAHDGLELAHITLRVLSPMRRKTFALDEPMERLEQLAEQGDTGAMCLMTGLISAVSIEQDASRYDAMHRKWLERGAELKHPECLVQLGWRLMLGKDGYAQDIHRGLSLEFAARRVGYAHDVWTLIQYYRRPGYAGPVELDDLPASGQGFSFATYKDLSDIRRLYCWRQIDERFKGESPRSRWLLEDLESEAQRTHRADLTALHDELQDRRYSLQDCVALGMGEPAP